MVGTFCEILDAIEQSNGRILCELDILCSLHGAQVFLFAQLGSKFVIFCVKYMQLSVCYSVQSKCNSALWRLVCSELATQLGRTVHPTLHPFNNSFVCASINIIILIIALKYRFVCAG